MCEPAPPYGLSPDEVATTSSAAVADIAPDGRRKDQRETEDRPAAGDTALTRMIVMVEGSQLHAGGLAALITSLSASIAVVSTVRELERCYREIDRHRPDMAIFLIRRISPEIVRFLRLLRERYDKIGLVVIVGSMERRGVQQLLALGLHGLLSADLAPANLLAALNAVRSGGVVVDPVAMSAALNGSDEGSPVLTSQELRILRLAAQGLRNGEMARQLSVSQSTLKRNLRLIFEKLGAKDRTSALIAATRTGLI